MSTLYFSTPRDLIEHLKEMFLKAENVDEFASDFYTFAFQDIDNILGDRKRNNGIMPIFQTLAKAKESLGSDKLEEGFNILVTPNKKKPIVYTIKDGKFVKVTTEVEIL